MITRRRCKSVSDVCYSCFNTASPPSERCDGIWPGKSQGVLFITPLTIGLPFSLLHSVVPSPSAAAACRWWEREGRRVGGKWWGVRGRGAGEGPRVEMGVRWFSPLWN